MHGTVGNYMWYKMTAGKNVSSDTRLQTCFNCGWIQPYCTVHSIVGHVFVTQPLNPFGVSNQISNIRCKISIRIFPLIQCISEVLKCSSSDIQSEVFKSEFLFRNSLYSMLGISELCLWHFGGVQRTKVWLGQVYVNFSNRRLCSWIKNSFLTQYS